MIAASAVLGGGVYVLFSGQVDADELAAAALAAAVSVGWSLALRAAGGNRFRPSPHALAAVGRALAGLPRGVLLTGGKLAAMAAFGGGGRIASYPFEHGARTDEAAAARRALGVLLTSIAPDRFVLRAPEGRDRLVLHELTPGPPTHGSWPP